MSHSMQIQEAKCYFCQSTFDDDEHVPRLLSCQHTFCQSCLEQVALLAPVANFSGAVSINCPREGCTRSSTALPAEGVPGLPRNFAIDSLVSVPITPLQPPTPLEEGSLQDQGANNSGGGSSHSDSDSDSDSESSSTGRTEGGGDQLTRRTSVKLENMGATCSICLMNYGKGASLPRILACGHTFCHSCLKRLLKLGTITCPQCRQDTHPTSVRSLGVNLALDRIVSQLRGTAPYGEGSDEEDEDGTASTTSSLGISSSFMIGGLGEGMAPPPPPNIYLPPRAFNQAHDEQMVMPYPDTPSASSKRLFLLLRILLLFFVGSALIWTYYGLNNRGNWKSVKCRIMERMGMGKECDDMDDCKYYISLRVRYSLIGGGMVRQVPVVHVEDGEGNISANEYFSNKFPVGLITTCWVSPPEYDTLKMKRPGALRMWDALLIGLICLCVLCLLCRGLHFLQKRYAN